MNPIGGPAALALAMLERHATTCPPEPSAGLLGAMDELARRPAPREPARREYDAANHVVFGIFAGKMTGGLTRYPYPPPRFSLENGVAIDRTYETDEARDARQSVMTANTGRPK